MRVAFNPGSGLAIAGCGGVALVAADSAHRLITVLVSAVESSQPNLSELAGQIAELGIDTLPAFAIVLIRTEGFTVLAHGDIVGAVGEGEATTQIRTEGVATWVEWSGTTTPLTFSLDDLDPPDGTYWFDNGSVPADAILIEKPDPTGTTDENDTPPSVEVTGDPDEPEIDDDQDQGTDGPDPARTPPGDEEPPGSAIDDGSPTDAESDSSDSPQRDTADFDFTHLVDHTVYRDPKDAEVGQVLDSEEADTNEDGTDGNGTNGKDAPSSDPISSVTQSPLLTPEHDSLISSLPHSDPPSSMSSATPQDTVAGDHDGHTVVWDGAGVRGEASSPHGDPNQRLVDGVLCSSGHANSPVAERCMTCGRALSDRVVRRVDRPILGRLQLPSGEEFPVNGPIVVGRMPVAKELIGGEVPSTVAIDDDVVTRNHAQILVEDWCVLIVDLGSTNQTMITIPGQEPRALSPHDPCEILPGTAIDLGGFGPVMFLGPH